MQATSELMKNKETNLILATGGNAMVKAAYSSGTPAIGVGHGNGPAYIERSANVPHAVKQIMDSKLSITVQFVHRNNQLLLKLSTVKRSKKS